MIIVLAFGQALGVFTKLNSLWRGESTKEKVLYEAIPCRVRSLDPAVSNDVYSSLQIGKIYEGLYEYHYTTSEPTLVPLLADGLPTVSKDGLTYTFKLKKGIKFQDNPCFPGGKGREITAEDWVFSFKRFADPAVGSPWYEWVTRIVGFEAFYRVHLKAKKTDYTKNVAGLRAVDTYTFQIILAKPLPHFLSIVAMPVFGVVPKEAVEYYGKEFGNNPVGTGPFCLEGTFDPIDLKLKFKRNPTYREVYFPTNIESDFDYMRASAGKKVPFLDRIEVSILEEESVRQLNFMRGVIDINENLPGEGLSKIVSSGGVLAEDLQKKGIKVYKKAGFTLTFFWFNLQHPLLQNKLLRQAMSIGFDRARALRLVGDGYGTLAQGIIPPGMQGADPDYINPYGIYDVAKAKQLLAEAGYPEGKGLPEINVHTSSEDRKKVLEVFQVCMRDIGVKVKVCITPFDELTSRVKRKGDTSIMIAAFGWGADYPDSENFLQLLYGPNKGGSNSCWFDNPVYNNLYEELLLTTDSEKKKKLYVKMNQLAGEQAPAIFLWSGVSYVLVHGKVRNYRRSEFIYSSTKYIDKD
jgi:ABC-type transport system substrate-binding protein